MRKDSTVGAIGDRTEVRGRLALAGYRSLAEWARQHGYAPVTARAVVYAWGERTDRGPHGGIARQVMADLRATLGRQAP